jgi:hypothetical protein
MTTVELLRLDTSKKHNHKVHFSNSANNVPREALLKAKGIATHYEIQKEDTIY